MTTITTTEQADALPVGFVLRLATGRLADRVPDGWTITGIYSPGPVPRGLYDSDLPAVVLHDPTQPTPACDHEALVRMIVRTSEQTGASAATLIRAAEAMLPAAAGVNDREVVAKAMGLVWDQGNAAGLDGWTGPGRGSGEVDDEAIRLRQRDVDHYLKTLPGRTVAQVKAEALREAAAAMDVDPTFQAPPLRTRGLSNWLRARADKLEREGKR